MTMLSRLFRITLGLVGAASCWWMALILYRTWQTPLAVDHGRWVSLGVGIMVLEFVLVHSGAMLPGFVASRNTGRTGILLLMSALYVMFGVCIALAFKSTMLFCTFSGIMIPRWVSVAMDSEDAKKQQVKRSTISVMLYLGVTFLSVFVPFPPGGLTRQVLDQVYPNRGHGLWEVNPQQALVAGMIYFIAIGLVEIITTFRQGPAPPFQTLTEEHAVFTAGKNN